MMRTPVSIAVSVCLLLCALPGFGAETLKLRQLSSIYADSKGSGFNAPEGVACGTGTLVVADSGNGRLLRYLVEEGSTRGSEELRVAEVAYPVRVQTNAKGEIFVLDGKQRRVARLSSTGEFLGYLDPKGMDAAGTVVARSFALDAAGNVYILDVFSGRVVVVDAQGKYLRQIAFPKEYGFLSDVTVDSRGTAFVLDSVNSRVFTAPKEANDFAPLTGELKEYINFPTNIAVDARGNLYISDQNSSGIVVVGVDGSFRARLLSYGWRDGFLRYPAQLCATESGLIVVADRDNNRVLVFTTVR